VEFHDVLRIGDEVNRLSRIARIEPKQDAPARCAS